MRGQGSPRVWCSVSRAGVRVRARWGVYVAGLVVFRSYRIGNSTAVLLYRLPCSEGGGVVVDAKESSYLVHHDLHVQFWVATTYRHDVSQCLQFFAFKWVR